MQVAESRHGDVCQFRTRLQPQDCIDAVHLREARKSYIKEQDPLERSESEGFSFCEAMNNRRWSLGQISAYEGLVRIRELWMACSDGNQV